MISTASVAIVPINHNALSVIVDTNSVIAPAFVGALPVTPAARNACACAITDAPHSVPDTSATNRAHLPITDIADLPGPLLERLLSTAETPRTPAPEPERTASVEVAPTLQQRLRGRMPLDRAAAARMRPRAPVDGTTHAAVRSCERG